MFVDKGFINQVQFDAGFAHNLKLKGAVPAIKDPGHDSELQTVGETASNVSVGDQHKCSSLFSSAHSMPPGALLFLERIVKLYLL